MIYYFSAATLLHQTLPSKGLEKRVRKTTLRLFIVSIFILHPQYPDCPREWTAPHHIERPPRVTYHESPKCSNLNCHPNRQCPFQLATCLKLSSGMWGIRKGLEIPSLALPKVCMVSVPEVRNLYDSLQLLRKTKEGIACSGQVLERPIFRARVGTIPLTARRGRNCRYLPSFPSLGDTANFLTLQHSQPSPNFNGHQECRAVCGFTGREPGG